LIICFLFGFFLAQQVNESESSAAATPDQLNSGFIDVCILSIFEHSHQILLFYLTKETVAQKGPATRQTCEKHSKILRKLFDFFFTACNLKVKRVKQQLLLKSLL